MKTGIITQVGAITTSSGSVSGAAGSNLSINLGSGNAAGNSAGGSLRIKPGASSGSGSGGGVDILPFNSTAGSTSAIRFFGTNSTNYVALKAPDSPTNSVWTLPDADGSIGQILQTNGSGVLSWIDPPLLASFDGNSGSIPIDFSVDTLKIAGVVGINTVASSGGTNGNAVDISISRNGLNLNATPVGPDQVLIFNSTSSNAPAYATLTSVISNLNIVTASTNGFLVRTAANTYASRTIFASSTAGQQGIVLTNGNGGVGDTLVGLNINNLSAGSVNSSTTVPSFDGTNNVKITPTQIVAARIVRGTFQNSTISGAGGALAVTHNLGVSNVLVQVYDENNRQIQPDEITLTSNNTVTIDLSSFGTISGTWSYIVFG
jgi:hypothetical protein